jgi:predicted enzyme related to lactoylglutathione lyase
MPQLIGKFVWFEHVSARPADAQRFYGEVLGWKAESFPVGPETYDVIKAGDAIVGGYTRPQESEPAHWISYVSVADVDATGKAIEQAGGRVLAPPFDVPGIGRMAPVADPSGARFYLFRGHDGNDTPDEAQPRAGGFHWNELWTTDDAKALAFYEKTLGYTHEDMDMGPQGTYRVLHASGAPRAGILADAAAAPHWLPYVTVDDCDAALARAMRAGGKLEIPGTEVPGVGRFGVFRDPQGARLAVIKPAPR